MGARFKYNSKKDLNRVSSDTWRPKMADKGAPAQKLVLKPGVICGFLENLSNSADNECLQFTELQCASQELENLMKASEEIKDVTVIDFSNNGLPDVSSLKDLTRLTHLNLANNKIKSAACFALDDAFPNLKWLDISNNKFNEWPSFRCPKLDYLNICGNKLEKISPEWAGHANLRIISAADNKFKSLAMFKGMPKLEELYLASNSISSFNGWEGGLPVLKRLHLRRNKIKNFEEELSELPELEYLNLRHNEIDTLDAAFKVFQFPKINDLNILNNPCDTNCSSFNLLMAEFLIKRSSLVRFCKVRVQESNLLEAVHLAHFRFDKSEAERKAAEAAEAAKNAEDD